jgi:hypothetical protein
VGASRATAGVAGIRVQLDVAGDASLIERRHSEQVKRTGAVYLRRRAAVSTTAFILLLEGDMALPGHGATHNHTERSYSGGDRRQL